MAKSLRGIVISLFGGLLGIGLGFGMSAALEKFLQWPTSIPPECHRHGLRLRSSDRRLLRILSGARSGRA
jgi:ABC-type lipoprotein release transport system permease subunit